MTSGRTQHLPIKTWDSGGLALQHSSNPAKAEAATATVAEEQANRNKGKRGATVEGHGRLASKRAKSGEEKLESRSSAEGRVGVSHGSKRQGQGGETRGEERSEKRRREDIADLAEELGRWGWIQPDVTEIYSPPRVTLKCGEFNLNPG